MRGECPSAQNLLSFSLSINYEILQKIKSVTGYLMLYINKFIISYLEKFIGKLRFDFLHELHSMNIGVVY